MELNKIIAKHFREVYFGGNWSTSNVKQHLSDVTVTEAVEKIGSLNTIAKLSYHIHYYVVIVTRVLEGGPLEGKDKYSFDHPTFETEEDWQSFLGTMWEAAENFTHLIENYPEGKINEDFIDPKYGTTYRNLQGIVEHTHYHLGQIVVIKKLIRE